MLISTSDSVALVGESGCGKSLTALAILHLLDGTGIKVTGNVLWRGKEVYQLSSKELHQYRGGEVAIIFQEPMTALNPVIRCGKQIKEVLKIHNYGNDDNTGRVMDLLQRVRLPDPAEVYKSYPHELSGGMRQRVLIAMAIAGNPKLLIADEPTTALDVTVQSQIIDLLFDLQKDNDMSVLFITHDLSIVDAIAERLVIMYAGQIVEEGKAQSVLNNPLHPYTRALLKCAPSLEEKKRKLSTIPGSVPQPGEYPSGCRFHPRCDITYEECIKLEPTLDRITDRDVRCPYAIK